MQYLMVLVVLLSLSSCQEQGVKFDPQFHVPSVKHQGLVNREGITIPFNDVAVQQFGCMSKEKIAELKLLLERSKPMKSSYTHSQVQEEMRALINSLQ